MMTTEITVTADVARELADCENCGAMAREPCLNLGAPLPGVHRERWRAAQKLLDKLSGVAP